MRKGDKRPIIVVKKKKAAHAGHHGGAWKVAYADFVTAMMAFFMVMWIIGMDQHVRDSIEGYFANPIGYKKGYTAGRSPLSSGMSPMSVSTTPLRLIARDEERAQLDSMGGRIKSRLKEAGLTAIGDRVEIVETSTGLRIELADGDHGQDFFPMASATMNTTMHKTLEIIAQELAPLRNPVIIEGHTDAAQYSGLYSNWELSADRANAARRVLEASGLNEARIVEVRGLADRQLRNPDNPLDPRNRRITIFLPFTTKVQSGDSTTATGTTASS
ncbi:MAG TPA: flagellar motor protein MotB [Gemmatimonadaceae bacterium]|nr:flagellar motor protein MotB [Gemmatimonadaceae bacterium]